MSATSPQCGMTYQRPADIAEYGIEGAEWQDCERAATQHVVTTHMGTWDVCDDHVGRATRFGGSSVVTPLGGVHA